MPSEGTSWSSQRASWEVLASPLSVGLCTHLGCVSTFRPEVGSADLGRDWTGGFYCPCHGAKFDLAGRVFSGVPAPTNLVIPEHAYLSDSRLVIGVDGKTS